MLTFAKVLLMLAVLSLVLSPARLAPYYSRCLSYCAPSDSACIARCDAAAGR